MTNNPENSNSLNKKSKEKVTSSNWSYITSYLTNKDHRLGKDLLFSISFIILSICVFLYLFSWVHELSHAITAIFNGLRITNLEVYWPYGGKVTYYFDSIEAIKLRIVIIAGSIGSVLVTLTLNRIIYYYRSIKFSIFMPLFGVTGYWMYFELNYWISGIGYWIRGVDVVTDADLFLDITPNSNPFLIQIFLMILLTIILIWLVMNFCTVIKQKKEIIKVNAEKWNRINLI